MKKKVFKFVDNTINWVVDAQTAGECIENIKERKGECTADDVLGEAKKEGHPLHEVFDWDNASAAHKHRIQMARQLIGAIDIIIEHRPATRAFVSVEVVKSDGEEKRGYITVEEAAKPEYEPQRRKEALNHLKVFVKRYTPCEYLATEVHQIQLLIDRMEGELMSMEYEVEIPV